MSSAVRKVSLILSFSPLCPLIPISPEHLYEDMYNSCHCDMSFLQKGKKKKLNKYHYVKKAESISHKSALMILIFPHTHAAARVSFKATFRASSHMHHRSKPF